MSDSSISMRLPPFIAAENARGGSWSGRWSAMSPFGTARDASCDDVGDARIHQSLDFVLEHQFLPLEPRDLELIPDRLRGEQPDLDIEPAVLGLERFKQQRRIVIVHILRRSIASAPPPEPSAVHAEQHRAAVEAR